MKTNRYNPIKNHTHVLLYMLLHGATAAQPQIGIYAGCTQNYEARKQQGWSSQPCQQRFDGEIPFEESFDAKFEVKLPIRERDCEQSIIRVLSLLSERGLMPSFQFLNIHGRRSVPTKEDFKIAAGCFRKMHRGGNQAWWNDRVRIDRTTATAFGKLAKVVENTANTVIRSRKSVEDIFMTYADKA